jgi:exoribonuclease-2
MIAEKALVLYKNRPALVTGIEDGKIAVSPLGEGSSPGSPVKVREKDVELLHPGPCTVLDFLGDSLAGDVRSAWELLAGNGEQSGVYTLEELAELIFGSFTPQTALAAWKTLGEGLFFTGSIGNILARPQMELEAEEKKREEKQRETEEREAFLKRLKTMSVPGFSGTLTESERRFLFDVEALALGKTDKSRTLKELGKSETPVEAHRFLLAAGAWTVWDNPHPSRFGLSLSPVKSVPPPVPEETRLDLSGLPAFAIDNSWSHDPDDAISLEGPDKEGRLTLWVHVADPAASILPGSPADLEARNRGSTLYLPEGSYGMLAPEALPLFALGFGEPGNRRETAAALSFKILLNPDLSIAETSIVPSIIRVTRLSYGEADALMDAAAETPANGLDGSREILSRLLKLAEQNLERRLDTGAVLLELPEVHIHVHSGKGQENNSINQISIELIPSYRSADMVRECMVLAGEGAALWAFQNRIPFPFVSQEAGDLPQERLPGLAGAWQLRRSMRPRSVSIKPGVHWGLGLDMYTQVTSPLRRYLDLLAHQQIRAYLKGAPLLSEEEILFRVTSADGAASSTVKAERASRTHWTAVYLADKKDSLWEAVVLDCKSSRGTVIIPALGIETQVSLQGKAEPNEPVSLVCLSAKIPEGEWIFASK